MTRSIIRRAEWLITRDRSEGAPEDALYEMQCTTCPERSEASYAVEDGQDWALRHSGQHPGHTGYRETVTRLWRTELLDSDAPRAKPRIGA